MATKDAFYVPCLRWRQAEYQALLALSDKAKDSIVPLITMPDLEFDFEDGTPKKTVGEHVGTFPKRYKEKWKTRKAWIDADPNIHTGVMPDGRPVFTFVFDEIRKFKADAMPVASLDCTPKVVAQIAAIVATDKKGVGVRARIEHLMKASFGASLDALLKSLKVTPEATDLIVDLGTPNYEPYGAFASALAVALGKIPNLPAYRNFIPVGCAFPNTLSAVSSPVGYIERHDWKFYVQLLAELPEGMRSPLFGDYPAPCCSARGRPSRAFARREYGHLRDSASAHIETILIMTILRIVRTKGGEIANECNITPHRPNRSKENSLSRSAAECRLSDSRVPH